MRDSKEGGDPMFTAPAVTTTANPPPDPMFDDFDRACPHQVPPPRRARHGFVGTPGFDFDRHDAALRAGRHSDVVVGDDGNPRWAGVPDDPRRALLVELTRTGTPMDEAEVIADHDLL